MRLHSKLSLLGVFVNMHILFTSNEQRKFAFSAMKEKCKDKSKPKKPDCLIRPSKKTDLWLHVQYIHNKIFIINFNVEAK